MINSYITCDEYDLKLVRLPRYELLESVYFIAKDNNIFRYMRHKVHKNLQDTKNYFKFCQKVVDKETGAYYAVLRNSDQQKTLLGVTALLDIHPKLLKASVTTWLGSAFWGQGYNKKIKHILFEYSFLTLNIKKLVFRVVTDNHASIKSHKKLGTKLEGVIREEFDINGKVVDINYYGLLRDEYLLMYPRLKLDYNTPLSIKTCHLV